MSFEVAYVCTFLHYPLFELNNSSDPPDFMDALNEPGCLRFERADTLEPSYISYVKAICCAFLHAVFHITFFLFFRVCAGWPESICGGYWKWAGPSTIHRKLHWQVDAKQSRFLSTHASSCAHTLFLARSPCLSLCVLLTPMTDPSTHAHPRMHIHALTVANHARALGQKTNSQLLSMALVEKLFGDRRLWSVC